MLESFHPELDDSPLLTDHRASQYRALIGSANWIVTLGRVDVAYAVSTMARYSMQPREKHLIAATRIFGYLKQFKDDEILVDPNKMTYEHINKTEIDEIDWVRYYPDAKEEFPPDQPAPITTSAQMTVFVDADHAHDAVTRRSVTGITLFVNNTPVKWLSKRQGTVESSTYGSEMVAAQIASELVIEYRYNLRMLRVEVDGPTMMMGEEPYDEI